MKIAQIRELSKKSTEESLFVGILREFSFPIVKICLNYNVSPNTVSIINILVGFFTPMLFLINQYYIGFVFLFLWRILDMVDGEIARIKKQHSAYGGFLDYVGEKILPPLLFISIGFSQNILLLSLLPAIFYVIAYYPLIIKISSGNNIFSDCAEGLYLLITVPIVYFALLFNNYSMHLFFLIMTFLYMTQINIEIFSINTIKEGINTNLKKIRG